jgi:hypothetical protein
MAIYLEIRRFKQEPNSDLERKRHVIHRAKGNTAVKVIKYQESIEIILEESWRITISVPPITYAISLTS